MEPFSCYLSTVGHFRSRAEFLLLCYVKRQHHHHHLRKRKIENKRFECSHIVIRFILNQNIIRMNNDSKYSKQYVIDKKLPGSICISFAVQHKIKPNQSDPFQCFFLLLFYSFEFGKRKNIRNKLTSHPLSLCVSLCG